ncbi:MAG: hypothetical protein QM778_09480 [Myxococcales bacterium]
MRRRWSWVFVSLVMWVGTVRADSPLRVDQSAERMRVDGALREWQGARFGNLGSGDPALRYALATADGGLYVAAEVSDAQLVRTKGVGGRQDALVLTLALPDSKGRWTAQEVWLHAGQSGRSKAEAGLRVGAGSPRPEPAIKVVEGPREQGQAGYVIEAFVPWSLIQGSDLWEQARGALRYEDFDGGSRPTLLETASAAKPGSMPRLALGVGQKDFVGSFLSSQNMIGIEPRFDWRANVYGDAAAERVVIIDRFVLVYGPGFKKGESFGYVALPFGMGGGIKQAELVDLDLDGHAELLLTLRQSNPQGAREVWMVYTLAEDSPRPVGGVELRKEITGGFLENTMELEQKGKSKARIIVKPGRSQNLTASNYRENAARDVQPILLPWGDVKSRTYGLEAGALSMVAEERSATATPSSASAPAAAAPVALEEVVAPSQEAVLALFRRDRKLPAKLAPRRHQRANVVAGPELEDVFELGNHLVVLGPEIGEGGSYLAYGLPVKDPAEVLYLGHADVTGDKREELFVRLAQALSGADGVRREIMLVLAAEEQGRFKRMLAAEVVRRQGDKAIVNRVSTSTGALVIEPGTAEGWSNADYPFTQDATGGVERLLIPWQDQPRRYRLQGDALVAVP